MYDINCAKNLNSLNSLYLVFNNLDACLECNSNECSPFKSKYLIFALTEKNKTMLKYYTELWEEIKKQIELITDDKVKYGKIL